MFEKVTINVFKVMVGNSYVCDILLIYKIRILKFRPLNKTT